MSRCCGHFLGTGSKPTVERNSQAVLLQLPRASILIDCGEGTQRQMLRVGADCSDLSGVFLTHHHIDHIYGLGGLVTATLLHTNLDVLRVYGSAFTLEKACSLAAVVAPQLQDRLEWVAVGAQDIVRSAAFEAVCFPRFHTETSLGYAFRVGRGKLAFLGDVGLPSDSAAQIIVSSVENADVLISDAAHITPADAAGIAQQAGAKTLYLMPISWHQSEQEARQEASAVFSDVRVPADLDTFGVEL
jgi:ribonuclease BN (tRNA processing enzyme)